MSGINPEDGAKNVRIVTNLFGENVQSANLAFNAGLVSVVIAVAFAVDAVSAKRGIVNVPESVLLQGVEQVIIVRRAVKELGRWSSPVTGGDLAIQMALKIGQCRLKAWILSDELIVSRLEKLEKAVSLAVG